ncbi:carbohydrate kinase family protein [Pseudobutyrivibrio ruminis]|uniref:Fructokinase n=1 Tax=Pseudobutyrivibrio ruminis DSM 9787 TaxID=1123011 RepID=A0A285SJA9_9FIRM|nr:carbohydrate kinase [Pseudobutyrivibrio ruminis]SOC08007.1 fructokinase [Pseudobutyrivibrio ruminis DSM 9787]
MEKKIDVVALGELLIDMTNNGVSENNNDLFEANPGGAPCNVLAMLKRFGHEVNFIGKVGDDIFGRKLKATLEEVGIGTDNLLMDKDVRTTLAFVETFPDGDRDFSFYRNPGADMMLRKDEVDTELIKNTKVFHFGTLSMTHELPREATIFALEEAKKNGAIITFDPNLREPLWNSLDEAKEQILCGMKYADYLKISDNEIQWLTGEQDYTAGVHKIREQFNIPLITVSLGKEGSRAYYQPEGKDEIIVEVDSFLSPETIETTGAGDTFCGCIIHYLLEYGIYELDENKLKEMLTVANAAASLITRVKGALRVMPSLDKVNELAKSR